MNIIMDDSLIFFDEDEQSSQAHVNRENGYTRSALWFIELGSKIFKGIDRDANIAVDRLLENEPDLEEMDAYFVQVGPAFEPNSFGLEQFSKRIPYANPELIRRRLSSAAERGWIEQLAENKYIVSSQGRLLRDQMVAIAADALKNSQSLAARELKRIDKLLGLVVDAALEGDALEDKSALLWSRKIGLSSDKLLISRVRRHLVDLFAFRDDAHISAWRPHEEFGYLWETFTYVWKDEANSSSELAERLHYRGFSECDYSSALTELVVRGWLSEDGGIYKTTQLGKALRERVEEQTNQYFDLPWESLTDSEFKELRDLLEKLADVVCIEKTLI